MVYYKNMFIVIKVTNLGANVDKNMHLGIAELQKSVAKLQKVGFCPQKQHKTHRTSIFFTTFAFVKKTENQATRVTRPPDLSTRHRMQPQHYDAAA